LQKLQWVIPTYSLTVLITCACSIQVSVLLQCTSKHGWRYCS